MQSVYEVLSSVEKETDETKKIEILRRQPAALQMLFQYALDPRVVWVLPDGAPPYREPEMLDLQANFWNEIRKLRYFCTGDGGGDHLSSKKREMMFINILESIDKNDAKVLLATKEKTLPFSSITVSLIKKAWPGLNIIENPDQVMYKQPENETAPAVAKKENSRKGSYFWITNGIENKALKSNESIPVGWWKGRISERKGNSKNPLE